VQQVIQASPEMSRNLLASDGAIVGWFQDLVDVLQPGSSLLQVSILAREWGQSSADALVQTGHTGVMPVIQQLVGQSNDSL